MTGAETTRNGGAPAALLRIDDLAVSFAARGGGRVRALRGVGMSVHRGQVLSLVGESGCGKSVTALSVLRLIPTPPGRYDAGRVEFMPPGSERPVDLLTLPGAALRRVRGGQIAMVFQEPMTCLNPVLTVGDQLIEAIRLHQRVGRAEARARAGAALAEVGIDEPDRRLRQYPHHFSGGMRQRAMIAMALACRPVLLLADEPTTALDVTIQAQVLELLRDLRRRRGLAIVLITHSMGVVAENADVVCVMYAGRVVEYAGVTELFENPLHPYTRALLACVPRIGIIRDRLRTIHEVMNDPSEFDRLGGGLRPWWPGHEPPRDAATSGGEDGHALVEVSPAHWAGVWRTPEAIGRPATPPDVAFRPRLSATTS